MAKILISFLGTGRPSVNNDSPIRNYRKAKYSMDGEFVGESPFVSSVLYDKLNVDSVIIIGTSKSMWEEVYNYYCEKNNCSFDEDYYLTLGSLVESSNHTTDISNIDLSKVESVLGSNSKAILIPYGLNRDEQLTIFSKITEALSNLQSGDEIILDITHSFRSLPLFSTSVINFIREVYGKDVNFSKVYYGMLDAIGEFGDVAPIIDISSTLEFNKWSTAAHSFKEYGKGYLLADLLGDDEGKLIKIFSDAVNINYLNEIQLKLTNFKKFANGDIKNEFGRMVIPNVLNSFVERLHKTGNDHYLFQLELSQWHYERKNYGSAFIVLVESFITYVCEKDDLKWNDKNNREMSKNRIISENLEGLKSIYSGANDIRKNIAHNLNKRGNKVEKDIDSYKEFVSQFKKIYRGK